MQKKLYRSKTEKVLSGVCGGVAEYFNIDVTLVRLIWVILTLPGLFPGIILYIVAAIINPEAPYGYEAPNDYHGTYEQTDSANSNSSYGEPNSAYSEFRSSHLSDGRNKFLVIIGIALIVVGGLTLFRDLLPSVWYTIRKVLFPISIIILGIAIIYSASKK